ncbi:MAG TPA: hypothetical protein VMT19_11530 [Thermoanaerobaculaceae bacterium]|nr:hypothetical protein [Thermoanaerobaculaceae bacterium]
MFRTVKRWPAEYERALEAPLRASRRLARRVANVEAHARLEAARTRALVERHTEDTLSWALAKERPIQLRLRVAKWVLDYFDSIPEESVSPGPVPLADGDDEAGVMLRAREHGATEEEMAALLIALDARKTR